MPLLGRINRRLESLFDGLFKGDGVQPLDLSGALGRALLARERVAGRTRYAPNHFAVELHPDDLAQLSAFGEALRGELKARLERLAGEHELTLAGPVELHFRGNPEQKAGAIAIGAEFRGLDTATLARLAAATVPETDDSTRVYKPERGPELGLHLVITGGPDAGRHVRTTESIELGRQGQDGRGALHDPNVSRRHARIERRKDGWFIIDLGSTNGTLVNEAKIATQRLRPGDRIHIGSTILVVEDSP
ncbi:MAG TPA: DUF3662 and FHA domain-containing protein [Limnochordia bacterium]|nr:DUF3662 and FHA domain-containing protein [Limnochordia bacterium]